MHYFGSQQSETHSVRPPVTSYQTHKEATTWRIINQNRHDVATGREGH